MSKWKCQHSCQSERGSAFPPILHHHEEAQRPGRRGPPTALVTLWNTAHPGLGLNLCNECRIWRQWETCSMTPVEVKGCSANASKLWEDLRRTESVQLWYAESDLTRLRWMCYNTSIVDELLTQQERFGHFIFDVWGSWTGADVRSQMTRGSYFCRDICWSR